MTRKRKSRNPGVGSIGIVKDDKNKPLVVSDKKPKKKTGKQAGNKQQEAKAPKKTGAKSVVNKDPRIGSKKPIVLTKDTAPAKVVQKKPKSQPIAAIRTIEPEESLEQELQAIEQDEQLQLILEKQDAEVALSQEEVNHFNQLMERHEQIRQQLGLDEEESEQTTTEAASEDDLWDKLDSSDFSEYE